MSTDQKITTFLMFTGQAEEAMAFYASLFDDSKVVELKRHEPAEGETQGKILHATFTLAGQTFMCIDSPPVHDFTFTPSISLYVNCQSVEEIQRCFTALARDGKVLMELGEYPFSKMYGWLQDRFGVSWQLSVQ